jgi:hypothetical protein
VTGSSDGWGKCATRGAHNQLSREYPSDRVLREVVPNAGEVRVAVPRLKTTIETVFGNVKANLGFRRFSMRGLDAASSEWRLVCTVHNLLKIHRHRLAAT